MNYENLLPEVVSIANAAGAEILDVYNQEFTVEDKEDGSPLTLADRRSHVLIVKSLIEATPEIPVLSEESVTIDYSERAAWDTFWLVDPLDGTKEFVKRNGEFTVNIALIKNLRPVLGVVYTPVQKVVHYGAEGLGACKKTDGAAPEKISVRTCDNNKVTIVASRSHAGSRVDRFRERLMARGVEIESRSMGSSLKICLVAEGQADVYPRLGPTSEWDTAAAHAVLEAAGGSLTNLDGGKLIYNKENILNPFFLAFGQGGYDWKSFVENPGNSY